MGNAMYCDLRQVTAEVDSEDEALLSMFGGRSEADRLILALDSAGVHLLSKTALWAMARAAELEQEQKNREQAREQEAIANRSMGYSRRREAVKNRAEKRRADKKSRAVSGTLWAAAVLCGVGIAAFGSPGVWLGMLGLLLMGTSCWKLLREGCG